MKKSRNSILISLAFALAFIGAAYLLKDNSASYAIYSTLIVAWIFAINGDKGKRRACSSRVEEL